jgi:hypothetical protein
MASSHIFSILLFACCIVKQLHYNCHSLFTTISMIETCYRCFKTVLPSFWAFFPLDILRFLPEHIITMFFNFLLLCSLNLQPGTWRCRDDSRLHLAPQTRNFTKAVMKPVAAQFLLHNICGDHDW